MRRTVLRKLDFAWPLIGVLMVLIAAAALSAAGARRRGR
jgi:hypothetical protein